MKRFLLFLAVVNAVGCAHPKPMPLDKLYEQMRTEKMKRADLARPSAVRK
jgi:hypothetical protein